MAQFARPDNDFNNPGVWIEDGTGDDTFLFNDIDEVAADDADFVRSPVTPSTAIVVFRLSDVTDPLSSTGHILRARNSADQDGQETIDFVFQLRQGYVNEGTPGTLINPAGTWQRLGVTSTTWTTTSYTLTAGEADAADSIGLRINVTANVNVLAWLKFARG